MARRRLAVMMVALLVLGGCTWRQAGDTLAILAEGLARGACAATGGTCRNTCPDGSEANAPAYRCAGG